MLSIFFRSQQWFAPTEKDPPTWWPLCYMFCFEGGGVDQKSWCLQSTSKDLVSDLILIKKLTKLQYLILPQSWDTGTSSLSLRINTQKFLVSESVLIFRLEKFQSRTPSQNWDSKNSSLGHGLETETQKFESRTWSRNWDSENSIFGLGLKTDTLKIPVSDLVSKIKTGYCWSLISSA